jgi:hypothetical protein
LALAVDAHGNILNTNPTALQTKEVVDNLERIGGLVLPSINPILASRNTRFLSEQTGLHVFSATMA